jgi:hypothetical protein
VEEHVKHFSQIEWVDFARRVATNEQRVGMRDHLAQDCATCQKTADLWTRVVEFAQRELSYEPPASAVRTAESYFFSFRMALNDTAGVRILRHVFDSVASGALYAMRSSGTAPRQLMYNWDNAVIDLRIEQQLGSERMTLTGQVVNSQRPENPFQEIPISLLTKDDEALHTTANQFGEFVFSFKRTGHHWLMLNLKEADLLLLLPEDLSGAVN